MNKSFLDSDQIEEEPPRQTSGEIISLLSSDEPDKSEQPAKPFSFSNTESLSTADTVRKSGMAYSAGIAFFASVVFMLVIGWGADLLFGSSPWGIVLGIVLGSIIGFVQFFRITSQIFKSANKPDGPKTLFSDDEPKR